MMNNRIVSLVDEIRMHLKIWLYDNDFRKLRPELSQALTMAFNQIKVHDAILNTGVGELKENQTPLSKERKIFIAIFKQRYLQNIDLKYDKPLNVTTNAILTKTLQKLLTEGTNSQEFLEWLWTDFFVLEKNKKYLPCDIAFVCNSWIVDKFLYLKKDSLRIRKKDLVDAGIKNKITQLSVPFLQKYKDKEFGEKVLLFARGQITITKFLSIFKKFCEKYGDIETKQKIEGFGLL